jgi:hypothetical protein
MQGEFFFLILLGFVLTANWQTIILLQKSFTHPFNNTCHISFDVWYRHHDFKIGYYEGESGFSRHVIKLELPATSGMMNKCQQGATNKISGQQKNAHVRDPAIFVYDSAVKENNIGLNKSPLILCQHKNYPLRILPMP